MKVFLLGANVGNQVREFFASIAKFCTDIRNSFKSMIVYCKKGSFTFVKLLHNLNSRLDGLQKGC